ncbi:Structural maintenance of chromosomes protein 6 [Cricetulus griseus]|uniref:Structural maintenance of chromosomes protein 6 n=1 Tax=Cricetulus griseus TaxID=10029 RepID=G3HHY3_CRIGR|nr:Structural maintenance of chromosomes protein 6 [Cricetulus griseus]
MAWAVVNEIEKQLNAIRDNIKIGEEHAAKLDRKWKNSRSDLMMQNKSTKIFKIN